MNDTKHKESSSSQMKKLTSFSTLSLAASIIAAPHFPKQEDLPKTIPLPFTNFGHQPIIDHELLQNHIWATINNMKNALKPWKKKALFLNVVVILIPLLASVAFFDSTKNIGFSFVVGIILISTGLFLIKRRNKKFRNILADIKIETIENLLSESGQTDKPFKTDSNISKRMQYFGSGELGVDKVPVLTITDPEDPFPGYGRLQLDNTFVCRPKDEMIDTSFDEEKINEAVFKNVQSTITRSVPDEISTGMVITLHGDSLRIDSKWLNEDWSPVLWVQKDEIKDFLPKNNIESSSRVYYAIHVVFPEHKTTCTFFFRSFLAGNAASCHVAVTTIGPPILDKKQIQKLLLKHRLQKEDKRFTQKMNTNINNHTEDHNMLNAIKAIGSITDEKNTLLDPNLDLSAILKLEIIDEDISTDFNNTKSGTNTKKYIEIFNKIVDRSTTWPGSIGLSNSNIADLNSYSFTTDFYGKPELLSSIRSMYDQVSRSILDSFESLGFNISDYRDNEGNYSINADKIDSIIVGEKIHIEKKDKEKKKNDKNNSSKKDTKE